ncbi:cell cycle progression protein 1-like [Sinocyclocheilus grahami]|uniref:cell cycle progression protein 1-like n=1 Tax=Sinocyclocheilus grahami TaxID=75366 RepID=UPI0007AC68B1|nr:PREDICTED: cell cycle progression protein 1-like [Sinocyclocheilus grahami]
MSDSSSDTESSCGWTVISNEGSDIENLGPDYAGECEDGAVSHALDVPDAKQGEESLGESSLDLTLREEAEPAQEAGGEEHVTLCSSSENSDIITLADSQEAEIDAWEEPVAKEAEEEAGSEELYLGSSSSSQYTFRESETMFPADQPVQRDGGNSSSEDEEGEVKASPVLRRRRVRRSTAGSEPGDPQEPHRRQEEAVEGVAVYPDGLAARQDQGPVSSTLNRCILLALLIAISMGFGHFYGDLFPISHTLLGLNFADKKELDKERMVTDKLKEELEEIRKEEDVEGKTDPETEELQARLQELENKLKFEQQRSDLWERLYVESKEERAKGDRDVKTKIPKDGMLGKVKETLDAVKNSTKEFVHHHKEQIKKAKEAVKENLRKFSDSVKSTFRHFKDSASNVFSHEKRFHDAKPEHHTFKQEQGNKRAEDWQPQKPLHRHPRKSTSDSVHADRNTRKPGAQRDHSTMGQKTPPKGCSGVFDCAYQESMSLFNKAMDPIRADEFNELLRSYLQKEVGHFHHWRELESFIDNFFYNGVFIHDQMLFTDFVSGVEDYLEEIDEYHSLSDDVFEDLDDYIYRHIFGDTYLKYFGPR